MPVIAIVGAGPGIGEAVAKRFAAEGFVVALLARTENNLHSMAARIDMEFGKSTARSYVTDLRNEGAIISSFAKIREQLGPVQVMVYNAGARRVNGRSLLDTTTEEFESFTKINLFGAFWSTKCVLPDMLAGGAGTILYTGATGSLRGSPGFSSFSPGKFGPVDGNLIGAVLRRRWAKEGLSEKLENIESYILQPAEVAKMYWFLHAQPRSSWTQELDVRPQKEPMFSKF